MDDIIAKLEKKFRKAVEIAEKYGDIIGWVSRTSPSSITEEGGIVIFDVDPATYFSNFIDIASAGSYLAVVDIKTEHIISMKVLGVERRDILAELDLPDMYISLPGREVSGLLTRTRVKAKPLLEYDPETGSVSIANYVIEPQSPVIKLRNPVVIQKILGLPTEGVFIGYVTIGDKPVFDIGAPLYLPLKTFYQHVLVLGTTGSGKTTLLKNMVTSLYSRYNIRNEIDTTMIIMDPNRDYVTLPLKPRWEFSEGVDKELEQKILEKTKDKVKRPKGLVIILPITRYVIERIGGEYNWAKTLKFIAEDYVRSTYESIALRMGWSLSIDKLSVIEEPGNPPLRFVKLIIKVNYGDDIDEFTLFIIPYGFRFKDISSKEFISLNPYFTRQAKDGLFRLMNYLKAKNAVVETIYDFYESLREARIRYHEKPGTKHGIIIDPNREYIVELIKELAIHKSTLENMIRQIGSLIDTGLFDIEVKQGKGEDKYLHEPPIETMLEKHYEIFEGYPIIIDLEYLQENSIADPEKIISIVAFRILNRVFSWKILRTRQRIYTQPVIILIDEAHRFFPSKGGGREEYIEHVSSMIDRIARLGRARRLGLVFSTHSPKDVHDIILQLANTKIVLRMDKSQLSSLDIPSEYRELVIRASDRVGIVKSHILRMSYISFRTPLPLAGHYDLSAINI
ncbi:AAA ATPase [Staphylothermus marinus F1]|uniref:AAA ATPase n=1 Tax=Staphylothermus marinus (strain ATCC 43588 / DSM 3639 / JCM 9404 / F1) TaxID=399550 RepID=A3DNS2_STAMF|nr:ATP-binding protein [Staphylothermus marinus]ABN70282.1 AAA ATPase [Staphylothermus marinus F1]